MDLSDKAIIEYGTWIADYEEAYGNLPTDLAKELNDVGGVTIKATKCTDHSHGDGKYKCN